MKTLIIGCGNMGRTYVEGFLNSHVFSEKALMVLDHAEAKCQQLRNEGLREVYQQPDDFISTAELIILAVKPQDTARLYPAIQRYLKDHQVVLSIMAGKSMDSIIAGLRLDKVIRAMPNIAMTVHAAATGLCANAHAASAHRAMAQSWLRCKT